MLDRIFANFEFLISFGRRQKSHTKPNRKSYNVGYFEDCRSSRNRSLLCVNEDFENEQDAKRATLDGFLIQVDDDFVSLIRLKVGIIDK